MGVVQDFSVPGSAKTGEVFLCPADLPWGQQYVVSSSSRS